MRKIKGIIFDMDGCLYPFDRGSGKTFGESQFGQSIKTQELVFIQDQLSIGATEAAAISGDLKQQYNHHLSIALEREHGISRETFFNATWNLLPEHFIDEQPQLASVLGKLSIRTGLLTAAPKIWADRVLKHLGVQTLLEPNILCGDQDVRKPDPQAFQQVADMLEIHPKYILSIGDQEHTDILPAQSLGMMTMKIGSDTTSADFLARDITDAINQLNQGGFI